MVLDRIAVSLKTVPTRTPRSEVYSAIDSERAYQDHEWPDLDEWDEPAGNRLTVGEHLLLIEEYARKAREIWATEPKPEKGTLDVMRKIGGIAVNCMEQHGAPRRRGY